MKKELIEEANKLKNKGMSITDIAFKLNIPRTTLSYNLNKNGAPKYKGENIEKIIQLYKEEFSIQEIKKKLLLSTWTITKILKSYNITIRNSNYERQLLKINPFINTKNRIVQYWLGYIASDGNVALKTNRISLYSAIDKEFILEEYYNNFLKRKGSMCNRKTLAISFSNKEAKETLINLGIVPNKSLILNYKQDITWDFIRGIFDGDGCISGHRICITTGSMIFANQLNKFLTKEGIKVSVYKKRNTYDIYIWKQSNTLFATLMYKDTTLYLKRKHSKFIDKDIV